MTIDSTTRTNPPRPAICAQIFDSSGHAGWQPVQLGDDEGRAPPTLAELGEGVEIEAWVSPRGVPDSVRPYAWVEGLPGGPSRTILRIRISGGRARIWDSVAGHYTTAVPDDAAAYAERVVGEIRAAARK